MASQKQSLEYIALRAEYVKLAKRADQRLVRIEQLQTQKGFENVTKYAYAWAQKNLQRWSGKPEGSRFNAAIPSDIKSLSAKLQIVKQFLDMQTSTKGGILKTYKKRADSINKKYGTNFTWQDLSTYFNSSISERAAAKFGSKTALRVIGKMQKDSDEVIKAIKEKSENTVMISGTKNIKKKIAEFLKENGLELIDLL